MTKRHLYHVLVLTILTMQTTPSARAQSAPASVIYQDVVAEKSMKIKNIWKISPTRIAVEFMPLNIREHMKHSDERLNKNHNIEPPYFERTKYWNIFAKQFNKNLVYFVDLDRNGKVGSNLIQSASQTSLECLKKNKQIPNVTSQFTKQVTHNLKNKTLAVVVPRVIQNIGIYKLTERSDEYAYFEIAYYKDHEDSEGYGATGHASRLFIGKPGNMKEIPIITVDLYHTHYSLHSLPPMKDSYHEFNFNGSLSPYFKESNSLLFVDEKDPYLSERKMKKHEYKEEPADYIDPKTFDFKKLGIQGVDSTIVSRVGLKEEQSNEIDFCEWKPETKNIRPIYPKIKKKPSTYPSKHRKKGSHV